MRKKLLFIFVLLLTAVTGAWAKVGDQFVVGNVRYTITSESPQEVNVNGYSGDMPADYDLVIPSSVTNPDNSTDYAVTGINNTAFYIKTNLKSVTIPSSVTWIGQQVFADCTNLATVNGCEGVTYVGDLAFNATAWFTAQSDGVVYIGKVAYVGKNVSGEVSIKEGTVSISPYAFRDCTDLTSVSFPDGLKEINYEAFYGCSGLTSITIPASVTSIAKYAFWQCNNLTSITLNSNPYIDNNTFYGIADDATVTMNLTGHEGATGEYWMTFYNDSYNFQTDANTQVLKAALNEKSLTLTELAEDKIVKLGKAVILKSTSSSMVMTLTKKNSSNDFSGNNLQGVNDPAGLVGDGSIYVLGKGSGGVGFYKLKTGSTLGYGKAYLTYNGGSPSNFFGFEESETTSIELKNSRIEELKLNSGWYTLGGLKLQGEPTEKGVYIYNGKKVVK